MASRLRSDINVTPLVDIVLVLLIVFITLVPALPRVLSAALPGPGEGGPALPRLCLTLTKEGRVEMVGRPDGSWATAVLAHRGRIVLRVHPDLPLSAPTRVLDEIEGLRPGMKVALVAWSG
jgi:biopolymer transport protein ExbD